MARTHIWLLALGGPEREEDLRPWLSAVLRDPSMMPVPMRMLTWIIVWMLLRARAPAYTPVHRQLSGGAPQLQGVEHTARELERLLGSRYRATAVFRHHGADLARAAAGVAPNDQVLLLPMHPQLHGGAVRAALYEAKASLQAKKAKVAQIESWATHAPYVEALAAAARRALLDPTEGRAGLLILARGLPEAQAAAGDPYPKQAQATAAALAAALGPTLPWRLAFAPVGFLARPFRSHGPPIEAALEALAHRGVQRVIVVPIGAATDDLEGAWARQGPLRAAAAAAGLRLVMAESPASSAGFSRALIGLIHRAEREAGWPRPEDRYQDAIRAELAAQGARLLPEDR